MKIALLVELEVPQRKSRGYDAAEMKEELGHYKEFLGRDEKELKQTRAEYEKVVNELDDERKEYQKQVEVAANASSKTTAAKVEELA